ncbi:hypothetical protein MRX96_007416 [Rhipicephalus microplus]
MEVLPRCGDADACRSLRRGTAFHLALLAKATTTFNSSSAYDLYRYFALFLLATASVRHLQCSATLKRRSLTPTRQVLSGHRPTPTLLVFLSLHIKMTSDLGKAWTKIPPLSRTSLNTEEEDAYNDACLKVVCSKRRARNAAALEAASPLPTDLENPQAKPRPSAAQRLPPLLFRDETVVLRTLGGLILDLWPRPT